MYSSLFLEKFGIFFRAVHWRDIRSRMILPYFTALYGIVHRCLVVNVVTLSWLCSLSSNLVHELICPFL